MLIDPVLANSILARTSRSAGVDVLLDVWRGVPSGRRAAAWLALGDFERASAYEGAWRRLAQGDAPGALAEARENIAQPGMRLLEAEALIAVGCIAAGLARMTELHHANDEAASLALARRRHLLGDHAGAEEAALALPEHAQAALVGARAALATKRFTTAFRFVEGLLNGVSPIPEPGVAGAIAVVTATVLARSGRTAELKRFAKGLVDAVNVPDEMLPMVARAAWTGGYGSDAWTRCAGDTPWAVTARLELALLAGNGAQAAGLLQKAGLLGTPSTAALLLLQGGQAASPEMAAEAVQHTFRDGAVTHLWRTHPARWQPWIDAALATSGDVSVYDLAAGRIPPPNLVPDVVLDDGSLMTMLAPVPVPVRAGPEPWDVWIAPRLCMGYVAGLDWPEAETQAIRERLPMAASAAEAAVQVLPADGAFDALGSGRPTVAIAPPGDPFWAGPLAERAWPGVRVVRVDSRSGWAGAGERVAAAVASLKEQVATL